MAEFYSQSWSLSVEEFFYLLFPIALFCLCRSFKKRHWGIGVSILIFLVLPTVLRIIRGPQALLADYDEVFRKVVIYRLDALMFGVLLAYFKSACPETWRWMLSRSVPALLLGGVAVFALTLFGPDFLLKIPWWQIFFLPLISLSVAMTFPFFDQWKRNVSWAGKGVTFISKISYSIYLSHLLGIMIAHWFILKMDLDYGNYLIVYPLFLVVVLGLSCGSYYLIEQPFMAMRSRINRRTPLPAPA